MIEYEPKTTVLLKPNDIPIPPPVPLPPPVPSFIHTQSDSLPFDLAPLQVLAGLWPCPAGGSVQMPPRDQVMFLPQKPFLLDGTLYEQVRPILFQLLVGRLPTFISHPQSMF